MQLRSRWTRRAALVLLVLLVMAAGFAAADSLTGAQEAQRTESARSAAAVQSSAPGEGMTAVHPLIAGGPYAIADVVEAVGPAVVFIEVEYQPRQASNSQPFPFFEIFPFPYNWFQWPPSSPRAASGSGFIIDESGLVLTNQHLFAYPQLISSIKVTLPDREEPIPATLRGYDYELDLAILQLEAEGPFPTVPLGDSDQVRVGEWVIAIGNPYRLEHTVTVGVLSAKGRQIQVADPDSQTTRVYRNLMQTDAAINPGNSGGPLLNLRGEAIGINTAVRADAQGIGFAIPINEAKAVLEDLITRGMVVRPFIGIRYDTVDASYVRQLGLRVDRGIIILDVIPGSAAEKAGLRVRDVIVAVGDTPIANSEDFAKAIEGMRVGDVLVFTVNRGGREVVVRVEVGERPASLNF